MQCSQNIACHSTLPACLLACPPDPQMRPGLGCPSTAASSTSAAASNQSERACLLTTARRCPAVLATALSQLCCDRPHLLVHSVHHWCVLACLPGPCSVREYGAMVESDVPRVTLCLRTGSSSGSSRAAAQVRWPGDALHCCCQAGNIRCPIRGWLWVQLAAVGPAGWLWVAVGPAGSSLTVPAPLLRCLLNPACRRLPHRQPRLCGLQAGGGRLHYWPPPQMQSQAQPVAAKVAATPSMPCAAVQMAASSQCRALSLPTAAAVAAAAAAAASTRPGFCLCRRGRMCSTSPCRQRRRRSSSRFSRCCPW